MRATLPPMPNLIHNSPQINSQTETSHINTVETPLNDPADPIGSDDENPWGSAMGNMTRKMTQNGQTHMGKN